MLKPTFKERFFVFLDAPGSVGSFDDDIALPGLDKIGVKVEPPKEKPKSKAEIARAAAEEKERVQKITNRFQLGINTVVKTYNKINDKLNSMRIQGDAVVSLDADSGPGNYDQWQEFDKLITTWNQWQEANTDGSTKVASISGSPKTGYQFTLSEKLGNLAPDKIEQGIAKLGELNRTMEGFLKKVESESFKKAKQQAKSNDDAAAAEVYAQFDQVEKTDQIS